MKLIPKKSLGQHFLNSRHVLDQIIRAAEITSGENVLEIGPGSGVLTTALLKAGAHVCAVEKDDRAYELLKEKFSEETDSGQLELIQGDILKIDIEKITHDSNFLSPARESDPHAPYPVSHVPYSLVANIPYYITGAILEKFLEHGPRPHRMVLLVQKEVAERIVARDGKESILSISVKAFGTPRIIAKVPRGAFTPAPTVDSAILKIENISNERFTVDNLLGEIEIKRFFEIVRAGFAHKRKFTLRNLESIIDREILEKIWGNLGLSKKIRAEDIAVDQWFDIISSASRDLISKSYPR